MRWLRVLSCGSFATAAVCFVACSGGGDPVIAIEDAGEDATTTPTNDSSDDDRDVVDARGTVDARDAADASDAGDASDADANVSMTPAPAKIVLVNAVTDFGPNHPSGVVRICYATKTPTDIDYTMSPLPPLPHSKSSDSALPYPGIPIGTGGPFPSTGLPLEGISLRPYLLNAKALSDRGVIGNTGLGATVRCNRVLEPGFVPDGGYANDAGALAANADYWQLADIPAGALKNNKTYLLAITGCTSDTSHAFDGMCGPDPANAASPYVPPQTPGIGNLRIALLELDATATIAVDEMGVQIVHLSPQYHAARVSSGGTVVPPFTPLFGNGADAAANVSASANEIAYSAPPTVTALAKLKGIVTTTGYFAANVDDPNANGPYLPIPLNNAGNIDLPNGKLTIQYLTEEKTVPTTTPLYANGKAYTFVLVGDPAGTTGTTRKIHFLAFPNQFTPPPAN